MQTVIYNNKISSQIINLRPTVHKILSVIHSHAPEITDDKLRELKLIFSEAIANSIVHGNNSDEHKCVKISVNFLNDTVIFKISDEGTQFDYNKIKSNMDKINLLSEHGRGFLLIESLSDKVEFSQETGELIIYKKVRPYA